MIAIKIAARQKSAIVVANVLQLGVAFAHTNVGLELKPVFVAHREKMNGIGALRIGRRGVADVFVPVFVVGVHDIGFDDWRNSRQAVKEGDNTLMGAA